LPSIEWIFLILIHDFRLQDLVSWNRSETGWYGKTNECSIQHGITRQFNLDNESDQKEGVIVNKAFVEKLSLKDPLEKTFVLHDAKRIIVGVVENHIDNVSNSGRTKMH